MFIGGLGHQVSGCPDGETVPVAALGIVIKDPAVIAGKVVVKQAQDGEAAHGAEAHHPAGDMAAGQRFGDDVRLGGDLRGSGDLRVGCIQKNIHAEITGIRVLGSGKDPFVIQFGSSPDKRRIENTGIGFDRSGLHMQQNGVHDAGAEPGDQKPVLQQILLIIGAVVGDQLRLALPLMHFKGVVDPVKLTDLALCVEEMGETVIPGTELLFQLHNAFYRVEGLPELRLQELTQLRLGELGADRIVISPGGSIPGVEVFLMNDDSAPLQEGIDREPPEVGQPVFQADFSVTVQPELIIEELPGRLHDLFRRHFGVELQTGLHWFRAHALQNGASGKLCLEQDGFKRVPEDPLVDGGIPVLVEHGKQFFKLLILVVASCGTIDDIPVDIHIAVAVVGLEVRSKRIVLRTVPY